MRCAPPASLLPKSEGSVRCAGVLSRSPNRSEGKRVCFRKIVQNTFIELSMEVLPDEQVRHNLNVFWGFQGENGGDWTWFGARMIHALTETKRCLSGFCFTMKGRIRRLIHHSKFKILFTFVSR